MNDSGSQQPVFALLADPATHGGEPVKRIDTHAASVFLAGTRAFKVKHAVRFPFLDYSTLDRRRQACEAELEINRPFAPEIYRRVVAITRGPDGRLALDGAGTAVEWAVEMLRFDETATLDRLADAGRIDAALADALGRAVAMAHAAAPAALASEASGQRGNSMVRAPDTRPEPGSSARAALASEASGQRGNFMVRAHSASEDIRAETPVFAGLCCKRADDTRPEPGSSARAVEAEPWIAALADYIEQNDAAFREMATLFPPAELAALTTASRAAHARIHPLLAERGRRGLIRRGHGDLHLGNIVLIEQRPVLFDAIEFDPLVAAGDVLYDLAFLLMDLTERGLVGAANIVLNRYLLETKRTEDLDALAALPFFLSMRAAIRAKVTAARIAQAEAETTSAIERSARKYFEFACRFIDPPPPLLVVVGGLSGTGKSVLARMLAPDIGPAPGAVVLRSDVERKTLLGMDEQDRLPAAGYSPDVTARVYATIADKARRAVAAGHSAIVDAVLARPQERAVMEQSAAALGVPFCGFFLDADLDTRLARVGTRSRDASDADTAVARSQESYDLGALDWTRIDASGTPDETFARAREAMGQ